jgi:predicted AAA+ superfamily ATPase
MSDLLPRLITPKLQESLDRGRSILLLGARQTGKSTLCKQFNPDLSISLLHPALRQRYELNAALLIDEVKALAADLKRKPLVFIDEIQKIPSLLDAVQYLIDEQIAQFIITGSSARKLRKPKVNWLPGRVILYHLDPLMLSELKTLTPTLENLLQFGQLPRIVLTDEEKYRIEELRAYVQTYVEDEIRAEAAVRNVSDFVRFLPLAASQSGKLINFNSLSQELGIAHSTISNYFQILEDCKNTNSN